MTFNLDHSPLLKGLFSNVKKHPAKTAVITTDDRRISYRELWDNIIRAAVFLQKRNIKQNEKIMLSAQKEVEFIYLYLAAHLLGITNVVVDAKNNKEHLEYIASEVNPMMCVGMQLSDCSSVEFSELSLPEPEDITLPEDLSPNSTADIMFTSGTTGKPKGVLLSHYNVFSSASNINGFIGNSADDIELLGLPICHSFGLGRLRCNLIAGSTIVLHNGFANLKSVFESFAKYGVTGFGMVPAIWAYIKKFSGKRISQYAAGLRYIEIGSAALPIEDKQLLSELFPETRICMHYGLTEASRALFMEFHEEQNDLNTIGRPVSTKVDVKIMDEDGKEIEDGLEGEICIKGNMVTSGYLQASDNSSAFYGDYFRTGDLGRKSEEGQYYLLSRLKEIINVGGKKVSPVEIENAVMDMCGADSICVAVTDPDGILGEVPKLYVLSSTLLIPMEALKESLKKKLEAYKYPRFFELTDKIPTTANGKKKRIEFK